MLSAILVGDTDCPEFQVALAILRSRVQLASVPTAEQASELLAEDASQPDLILIAQVLPGEFHSAQFERLKRQAPLARLVRLLGSLCEGDGRTGSPWPSTISMYWHQAAPRLAAELDRMAEGRLTLFSQPLTFTSDDRLLSARRAPSSGGGKLIAVAAERFSAAEALVDACQEHDYRTVRLNSADVTWVEPPVACIWDATHWGPSQLREFEQLSRALAGIPLIPLISFPRHDDYQQLVEAGAAAVVSKPYSLDDLFFEVEKVVSKARPSERHRQHSA